MCLTGHITDCSVAYLEALRRALPRVGEGGALASVLEHCMYCGMSLGRVGLDFRGLLPPLFEAAVLGLFQSSVQARCLAVQSMCSASCIPPSSCAAFAECWRENAFSVVAVIYGVLPPLSEVAVLGLFCSSVQMHCRHCCMSSSTSITL